MPKREGVDALGLPFFPSSRSRPGTSAAANRPGIYTLGSNISNSSSSLVLGRNVAATASEPNLAAQTHSGPVPAVDAPHLSTTEAFFGRMTLTAPDNMKRKKAEEKEKKRQARKKRAERGAAAAATLIHPSENAAASSSQHHLIPLLQGHSPPNGDDSSPARQRNRRPALPTSNSTSNLHLYTLEHSRSRSPTRPARPHSAQTNQLFTQHQHQQPQQRETTRPRQLRRRRSGSDHDSHSLTSQDPNAAAPVYVNAETSQQGRARIMRQNSDNQSVPSTAAQRRRDIYADLESLGLPGANESDLEDQPPPFPPYATRPISPPRLPAEGEEWTEEMRRRQEEYEMNRPPDSPPPAFRSEDELHARPAESEVSLSDGESIAEVMDDVRKEWEDDILAGYTLEERISRDETRRLLRESFEREDAQGEGTQSIRINSETLQEEGSEIVVAGSPALNLGKLVMEARARRGNAAQIREDRVSSSQARASTSADVQPSHLRASTVASASEALDVPTSHREQDSQHLPQVISTETTPALVATQRIPKVKRRIRSAASSAAVKTRKDGLDIASNRVTETSQVPSRFRDGASAAAARRIALWGSPAEGQSDRLYLHGEVRPPLASLAKSEGDLPAMLNSRREAAVILAKPPPLHRRDTSTSDVASGQGGEGDAESSSDSDEAWDKEEAAFEATQKRLAGPVLQVDSSDEEDEPIRRSNMLRSISIDLARPGSNVPKAPPPLVLGRSRGGMDDYSSSSSSSSESAGRRMEDDSDDDSLSPLGEDDVVAETETVPTSTIDKGKQPMRPIALETDKPLSTPFASPIPSRAGQFEEDSGSSHDFATDEDVDHQSTLPSIKSRQQGDNGSTRSAVNNRLKSLFSTSLAFDANAQQQSQSRRLSAASRASMERLLDPQLSVRTSASLQNATKDDIHSTATDQRSSDESVRDKERANAYASLESRDSGYTAEQQARLEALEDISRLQRAKAEVPNSSTGIDQSSLDALERLLSRRSPQVPQSNNFNVGLSRSGAINRRDIPAPFVNPRSSIAPKPLGRLPTITSDTRHFPPSRNSTVLTSGGQREIANAGLAPQAEDVSRRNVVGTPSWMAYIPLNERRALPHPLEPTRLSDSTNASISIDENTRAPPPLPLRRNKSKVLAMVERFEGQNSSVSNAASVSTQSLSKINMRKTSSVEVDRMQILRRRPPPPPPPIPIPIKQSPIQKDTQNPEDIDDPAPQRGSSVTIAPPSETTASDNSTVGPTVSTIQLPLSHQSPVNTPTILSDLPAAMPRSRSRPLPIPPRMPNTSRLEAITTSDHPIEEAEASTMPVIEPSDASAQVRAVDHSPTDEAVIEETPVRQVTREASLGITDLDLFASRLTDQAPIDGTNYDDLHLLAEFLGPAKSNGATAAEVEALSVGVVEVMRKRVVGKKENGKEIVKLLLNVMGVKVERCGVCLVQFKEGNMACVFPCLHVLHEDCARKLLRSTKSCPTCRVPIA